MHENIIQLEILISEYHSLVEELNHLKSDMERYEKEIEIAKAYNAIKEFAQKMFAVMRRYNYYLLQIKMKQLYIDLIVEDRYYTGGYPPKKSRYFKQLCSEIKRIDIWLSRHPMKDVYQKRVIREMKTKDVVG